MKPLSGESREEIFEKLKAGGFRKEGVPEFLGGLGMEKPFLNGYRNNEKRTPMPLFWNPHDTWSTIVETAIRPKKWMVKNPILFRRMKT